MSHSGPSAVEITLSEDERAELVRRAEAPDRRAAERARIILACADGMSNAGAARAAEVAVGTVAKWRRKFAAEGLAGLQDAGRIGRPKAGLVLSEAERDQLLRWARRAKTAQYLALRAKIVLRCAQGGTNRQAAAELGADESTVERWRGPGLAGGLAGPPAEAPPRPAPSGPPAVNPARPGGRCARRDSGVHPGPGHALVAGLHGQAHGTVEVHHRADLEEVRPQAPPARWLQAVHRPAVRGQGRRRGRPLPQPSRAGGRALRGREVADSGAGPLAAGAADDARDARAAHP